MPSVSSRPPLQGRVLGVVRLGWAAALLAVPQAVIPRMGGQVDSKSVAVARILGARHAAQGALEVVTGSRGRHAGSMIDAAHSLTAAALGLFDASWRRVALTDAAIAATFAIAGTRVTPVTTLAGRAVPTVGGMLTAPPTDYPTKSRPVTPEGPGAMSKTF